LANSAPIIDREHSSVDRRWWIGTAGSFLVSAIHNVISAEIAVFRTLDLKAQIGACCRLYNSRSFGTGILFGLVPALQRPNRLDTVAKER